MTQDKVYEIWRRELKLGSFSMDDDFFMLGGHSLIMTRIQHEIGTEIGVEVPMDELFRKSTVASISAYIDSLAAAPQGSAA
ncbi:acyl carrier protein [Actinoplanes sp. TBRC 11911]|uniref:phosphopantetheine-binding protein n=1 Tax=Actinoplanes sp. TBRC 11911 TaxID=2729386 RepID=UPI00145CE0D3|nr:phosphopantetheine-binding protein [Actinoplanes sp. TBRC 11911]NMO50552.1 acyl carrier protein [Actinoplanes sp. TBRC 11911]